MPSRRSTLSTASARDGDDASSTSGPATTTATTTSSTTINTTAPKPSSPATSRPPRDSTGGIAIDDLTLPRTVIARLAKGVLPPNTSINKDALTAISKSTTVFVSYLASGAQDRADVLVGFSESAENKARTAAVLEAGVWVPSPEAGQVARVFYATLGRAPDAGGLEYWTSLLRGGLASLRDEALGFMASPEFTSRYGTVSDERFVDLLYQNVLGRPADAAGMSYWVPLLASGTLDRGAVVLGFSESAENMDNVAEVIGNGFVYIPYA